MKKRGLYFVLLIVFVMSFAGVYARELVIAGIPEEPNRWVDKNGKMVGIDIEIIDYIMKKMNVPYKVILEDSSARLEGISKRDKPDYDMVFTYSKNLQREAYLTFAEESHISFSWNFFVLKENSGKIKFESYNDLKGLRIGITKGISYSDEFNQAAKDGMFITDEVVKNDLQMNKLLNKRIDAVPMNTQATLYEAKRDGYADKIVYLPKPIKDKPYYNTFVKKSDYPGLGDIQKKYDEILKQMKKDGTLKAILAKYGIDK